MYATSSQVWASPFQWPDTPDAAGAHSKADTTRLLWWFLIFLSSHWIPQKEAAAGVMEYPTVYSLERGEVSGRLVRADRIRSPLEFFVNATSLSQPPDVYSRIPCVSGGSCATSGMLDIPGGQHVAGLLISLASPCRPSADCDRVTSFLPQLPFLGYRLHFSASTQRLLDSLCVLPHLHGRWL